MEYKKLPLSIEGLANSLIDRGLDYKNHTDKEELKKQVQYYLSSIGYHRLSPYWYLYRNHHFSRKPRPFKNKTKFDTILKLYNFDRELRLLVMDAIERIEVALRAYWSQELDNLDSHGYRKTSLFKDQTLHKKHLDNLENEINDSKEQYIYHFRTKIRNNKKYCKQPELPIWAVVEIMSFGTLSKWFKNTNQNTQEKIADKFQIPNVKGSINDIESIFHSLTIIRNICAHHGRLWNRHIPNSANVIEKIGMTSDSPKFLYNHLVVIHHLMFAITKEKEWINRLMELLDTMTPFYHKKMGFPDNWKTLKPWNEIIKEEIKVGLTQ